MPNVSAPGCCEGEEQNDAGARTGQCKRDNSGRGQVGPSCRRNGSAKRHVGPEDRNQLDSAQCDLYSFLFFLISIHFLFLSFLLFYLLFSLLKVWLEFPNSYYNFGQVKCNT
jgi:hypothetical protein